MAKNNIIRPVNIDPAALKDIEDQQAQIPHVRKMIEGAKALGEDTSEIEDLLNLSERVGKDILKRFKPGGAKAPEEK
jgi:hypothetical protein